MKTQVSEHYKESMTSTKQKNKNNKSGITLVEILVSLLILALAILPAVGTFSSYYGSATRQMEQEMALKIAEATVNLLNSVSFETFIDETITATPLSLDIQTPDGAFNGKLYFKKGIENHPEQYGFTGTTSNVESEKLKINRVEYTIKVEAKRVYQAQIISAPHDKALGLNYLVVEDDGTTSTERYECFDDMYVFNVEVGFGKSTPIRVSSFRTDMVK